MIRSLLLLSRFSQAAVCRTVKDPGSEKSGEKYHRDGCLYLSRNHFPYGEIVQIWSTGGIAGLADRNEYLPIEISLLEIGYYDKARSKADRYYVKKKKKKDPLDIRNPNRRILLTSYLFHNKSKID